MDTTFIAQYSGFVFHCAPRRLGPERFVPRLMVRHDEDSDGVALSVELDGVTLSTPTQAARVAFAVGRSWVDHGFSADEHKLLPPARPCT